MHAAGIVLVGLAGVITLLFGIRYLLAKSYTPYHATVSGMPWESLQPRLQAVILGMLRVVGAGLLACGAAQLWLLLGLAHGDGWAPWAILTTALILDTPVLYVTLWLRRIEPSARTPVAPTAFVLVLTVAGLALTWAS